jgi:hypothetical protein
MMQGVKAFSEVDGVTLFRCYSAAWCTKINTSSPLLHEPARDSL